MSDDLKGPPPPGPIQPIFNDSLSQIEQHRRMLRAKANAITSPEARSNVTSAAAAFGQQYGKVPGRKGAPSSATKSAAMKPAQTGVQSTITTKPLRPNPMAKPQQNLIVPVNAQGAPIADPRPQPEQPKLSFVPAPDGTFCKIADRPRPNNHPIGQPWSQKFLATHNNEPFAIVRDQNIAELLANALNVYFNALIQRQAEQQAARAAAEAAANDVTVFDTIIDATPGDVDAVTGAPVESVGVDSDNLPNL